MSTRTHCLSTPVGHRPMSRVGVPDDWRRTLAIAAAVITVLSLSGTPSLASFPQTVFLDYDTFTGDEAEDHTYTAGERIAIVDTLNDKFIEYPVTFTNVEPTTGLFSTVFFNAGLGSASIDFQNKSMSDTATLHVPKLLDVAGITLGTATPTEVVMGSINLGAHETLHILGTRHHDAFLPFGTGVSPGEGGADWDPAYPGPEGAFLTGKEFNSLTTSFGVLSAASVLDPDLFVGPRSAVKLLHDTFVDLDEDSDDKNDIMDAQPLPLKAIPLPNPLPPGDPLSGLALFADAVIIEEASIDMLFDPMGTPLGPESDYYSFAAAAGDLFTFEVISEVSPGDSVDSALAVLDPTTGFTPVPWFAGTALNNDERESTDSLIQDLTIPADGTYIVEVFTPGGSMDMFGDYELLVYRLRSEPIPEPSSLMLALCALAAVSGGLRRRRPA